MTLLTYIEKQLDKQRKQNKKPVNITLTQLKNQQIPNLTKQLQTLYKQGKIKYYKGANHIHIYTKKTDIPQ